MTEDLTPPDPTRLTPAEAKAELAKREQARISRRDAFARIGFKAGALFVASLTADDLFRAVGAKMQQQAHDNRVVEQVAREMQKAGVAFAANTTPPNQMPPCSECSDVCVPDNTNECEDCTECTTSVGYPPKKKKKPICDAQAFWDTCYKTGQGQSCCDEKCTACAAAKGTYKREIEAACQQKCQDIACRTVGC